MTTVARLGAVLLALMGVPAAATPDETFARTVQPFLANHCLKCHGESKAKAGLRLDRIRAGLAEGEDVELWQKIADQLRTGEMPPAKEPRPAPPSVDPVKAWITDGLAKAATRARSAGGRVVIRRLNRTEYDNTIRDLFGVDFRPASRFPEDDTAHGFDTIGSALSVSPLLLEKYMQAAETLVSRAIVGAKPEVFKKRWLGREITSGKYIKDLEAAGKKPEGDSVILFQSGPQANGNENLTSYLIPYARPNFKTKLPGEYVFRVKASSIGCGVSEKLKGKIYYEPKHLQNYPEGPFGVILKVTKEGELVGRVNVTKTPEEYEVRAYAESGQSFEFTFENGPPNVNLGRLEVLHDYPGPGLVVHWIEIEGPVVDAWPPKGHRDLFFREGATAREILERFAARAFRRPATPAEVQDLLTVFDARQKMGKTFEQSVAGAVELALCSPSFLYLTEPNAGSARPLNAHELAARLSYFLWSTMPDEALARKAADGSLLAGLDGEVRRMLADPKAAALTRNFAAQWLHLAKLDAVAVDSHLFPYYTDYLRTLFRRETDVFFEEILRKDLSILNFIDSDFAMLNDRLALHYGIEGVTGPEFRRVALNKDLHRGGLLGQAGILTLTTCGTQTSPVMRGRWVLECLLGTPPPPPPKDVPALPGDVKGTKTIRERLAKHREDPSCASCHDKIDPYGLALENFSVVGLWRTDYGKPKSGGKPAPPVDAAATLTTGESFTGPEGVKDMLLKRKDRFTHGFVEKLLTYALGRGLDVADRATVDALVAALEKDGYKMSGLIQGIVRSEAFRTK
jgi:hypothetical protein